MTWELPDETDVDTEATRREIQRAVGQAISQGVDGDTIWALVDDVTHDLLDANAYLESVIEELEARDTLSVKVEGRDAGAMGVIATVNIGVDLEALSETDAAGSASTEGEASGTGGGERDEEVPCRVDDCERTFGSTQARNSHEGQAHPSDDEADTETDADIEADAETATDGGAVMQNLATVAELNHSSRRSKSQVDVVTDGSLDLEEFGAHLTPQNVVEKLTGVQTVYEAQRDLRIERGFARTLLFKLGLGEVSQGSEPLQRSDVAAAVQQACGVRLTGVTIDG